MITTIHKAETRGYVNHGWLKSNHTFSFASYYNPERIRFGLLRVLNDDIIEGGTGFGTHPHDNMEIISIPIYGALEHKDSMGSIGVISDNEIQVMSAGSGLTHSEYNHSKTDAANFLQIWIFPKLENIEPRYDQRKFDKEKSKNKFHLLVSPVKDSTETLWINQDAYISITELEKGKEITYNVNKKGNGVYLFVIKGSIKLGDEIFTERDGIGFEDEDSISILSNEDSRILALEVPMKQ